MKKLISLLFFSLLFNSIAMSCWAHTQASTQVVVGETAAAKKIHHRLSALFPHQAIDAIKESALPGFYEVRSGMNIVYISKDGRYLMLGDVLDLTRSEMDRSLSENTKRTLRLQAWPLLKKQVFVDYKPSKVNATLIAFVDPDCGYCQKFHEEIPALLDAGIEVRYLPFPRAGLGSPTAVKLGSAWCSADPKGALDQIMKGQTIEAATCDKQKQFEAAMELGQQFGVTGTPALLLGDGTLIPGFRRAKELVGEVMQHAHLQK